MSNSSKCRANNPAECMDPNCPEKQHLVDQMTREKTNFIVSLVTGKKVKPKKLNEYQKYLVEQPQYHADRYAEADAKLARHEVFERQKLLNDTQRKAG